MRLSEMKSVLPGATLTGDVEVSGISFDSRTVKPGDLFVALVGAKSDGHDFLHEAAAAGAAAVMLERRTDTVDVPQVVVADSRTALGKVSARFYDYPSRRLTVIGVTGTNGKTTTTYLIRSILKAAGKGAGLIGTISYAVGDETSAALNTTPESLVIQRLLSETADAGHPYAVLEVSSQALDAGRVDDVTFAAAVFTNLSREHLDHHKDMPSYARAKARLFDPLAVEALAVINTDDDHWEDVAGRTKAKRITYGFRGSPDVKVSELETGLTGSRFSMSSPWGERVLTTPLPGRHNVYNCVAAATVTSALGIDPSAAARGIAELSRVSGRLEPVDVGQDFAVFVDYAHSDDALENVLKAVRRMTEQRVIVVFGCGGDRDVTKRPRMRAVAEELADHCIVTSDNPRSEDPQDIIDQIMRGVRDARKFTVEPDRTTAIHRAVGMAHAGDVVLIAGKGHETYQIFRDRRIHFDDREVAREALRKVVHG